MTLLFSILQTKQMLIEGQFIFITRINMTSEMTFQERNYVWFEYFKRNYLSCSTMLASKGAPYFRSRFLDLVIEEFKAQVM